MFNLFNKKIKSTANGIWIVNNLVSESECNAIIERANKSGFKQARQFNAGRHNKEAFIDDSSLSELLVSRLKKIVFQNTTSNYRVVNLSIPLEFYKYNEGDFIQSHSDAPREMLPGILSSLTLVLYLNDNYAGGETFFTKDNLSISPNLGTALLFIHQKPHESLRLKKGTKYILRSNCTIS